MKQQAERSCNSFQVIKGSFRVDFSIEKSENIPQLIIELIKTTNGCHYYTRVTTESLSKIPLGIFFDSPCELFDFLVVNIEEVSVSEEGSLQWIMQLAHGIAKKKTFKIETELAHRNQMSALIRRINRLEKQLQAQKSRHQVTKNLVEELMNAVKASGVEFDQKKPEQKGLFAKNLKLPSMSELIKKNSCKTQNTFVGQPQASAGLFGNSLEINRSPATEPGNLK